MTSVSAFYFYYLYPYPNHTLVHDNYTKQKTNIVYFGLPDSCEISKEDFARILKEEYGVLVGYGYSKGGELFRACTHLDVDDIGVDHAIESIINLAARK